MIGSTIQGPGHEEERTIRVCRPVEKKRCRLWRTRAGHNTQYGCNDKCTIKDNRISKNEMCNKTYYNKQTTNNRNMIFMFQNNLLHINPSYTFVQLQCIHF